MPTCRVFHFSAGQSHVQYLFFADEGVKNRRGPAKRRREAAENPSLPTPTQASVGMPTSRRAPCIALINQSAHCHDDNNSLCISCSKNSASRHVSTESCRKCWETIAKAHKICRCRFDIRRQDISIKEMPSASSCSHNGRIAEPKNNSRKQSKNSNLRHNGLRLNIDRDRALSRAGSRSCRSTERET